MEKAGHRFGERAAPVGFDAGKLELPDVEIRFVPESRQRFVAQAYQLAEGPEFDRACPWPKTTSNCLIFNNSIRDQSTVRWFTGRPRRCREWIVVSPKSRAWGGRFHIGTIATTNAAGTSMDSNWTPKAGPRRFMKPGTSGGGGQGRNRRAISGVA
jgi:hypothetical protein